MRKTKVTLFMLRTHLRDWFTSPRTLLSFFFILVLTWNYAQGYITVLETNQFDAHFGEMVYLFLCLGFGNISVVSLLFLVMFSEVPRRSAYQGLMLVRSSYRVWLLSHVLFCAVITALSILLLLALSMIIVFPSLVPGTGWSDLERIAANPEAEEELQLVAPFVRELSPLQASVTAFLILFAFLFTMVLVILLCTLMGHPNVGVMLYAIVLLLRIILSWEMLTEFHLFMPADYATLMRVAAQFEDNELAAFPKVLAVYAIVDSVLIFTMMRYADVSDLQLHD